MIETGQPVPLILVTGFLGSGKTTLLNALLRHPEFAGTAVLVNEIGAVGIDHNLVVGASDDILLLEGGCLCCQPEGQRRRWCLAAVGNGASTKTHHHRNVGCCQSAPDFGDTQPTSTGTRRIPLPSRHNGRRLRLRPVNFA